MDPSRGRGKLLARKRPRLVPVPDKIIVARVGPSGQNRQRAPAVDVALWMLHSESTAAGKARAAASVTPQR
jgi:Family of unknown function (DUF6308)